MKKNMVLGLSLTGIARKLLTGSFSRPTSTGARKKILVLGGTNFLGPAIVERAVGRDHEVTLFNRGITRPHLFPTLEKLRGDRRIGASDLAALEGSRHWDAVIDVWPEHAGIVAETADLLSGRTGYYFYCSSIAVYTDFSRPNMTESAETHTDDPGWYGGEKALAEKFVEARFPGRSGIARCHAIVGPRDNGAAFHYWLRRLAQNEEVLAPGTGEDPVQVVDVRDVAGWIVDCVEQERVGVNNICGPSEPLTFREFLEESRNAIGSRARLTWVDADFLREEQGVHSFSDLPLWAPLDEDAGFYQIDGTKAAAAGATFRPLAETARDAWRWYQSHFFKDTSFPVGGLGLSQEREREVLKSWHEKA